MTDICGSMLAVVAPDIAGWAVALAMVACGFIIVGAALGIGWIGSKGVESIARQPEAQGRIFTTVVVVAALIEGITFFALLICFLALFWLRG